MGGDGGVDQVAAQAPKPRQGAVLIGAGEPAVADHIGDQDRSDLARLAHGALPPLGETSMKDPAGSRPSRSGDLL